METLIATIVIDNEMDLVLAHKYTTQLGEMVGLSLSDQTRLATAVAEICRNCVEYASDGEISYTIMERKDAYFLQVAVSDGGPGIPADELRALINGQRLHKGARGVGIYNSRKLVDELQIHSSEQGTAINLVKHIPQRGQKITPKLLDAYREYFQEQQPVSPYEELKKRNSQLLEITEQLRLKNIETEYQLQEIKRLNIEMEQKHAELLESRSQVQEGQESFDFIANNIQQCIWRTDAKGDIEYVNDYFSRYTGLSLKELQQRGWKAVLSPVEYPALQQKWCAQMENKEKISLEFLMRRSDGIYKWHYSAGEPFFDANGDVTMWLGTIQDIDERKRSSDELERIVSERTQELMRANDELSRSNMELEQFAYVASHDLQEPLRMVNSFSMLLNRRFKDTLNEEAMEYLQFIVEGSSRMQALISDLLSYSRVGRKDLEVTKVDLNKVLEIVKRNLSDKLSGHDIGIYASELPSVTAVQSMMVQLFQNLIDNAIKFRGDVKPEVEIGARQEDHHWLFWVKDNGIGIEFRYKERIFTIFQRLHTRDKYPGTGMGLAICKKIIDLYGGSIWVDSIPGQGSTFYFTLPIQDSFVFSEASLSLQEHI